MKTLNIFKPGKHTSSNGVTLNFSEDQVREMVNAYDPDLHEAPIVIGHPKDNAPAYGWVKALRYSDKTGAEAEPHQVDEAFSEMVAAGRFKKISASFYTPDSPNNPVPGNYYLRHVGFLGAQPPAVKGLRDATFSEDEDGVIEFAAWETGVSAGIFRRLREFLLEKFGADTADKVIPSYAIEDLEDAARRPQDETQVKNPSFTEHDGAIEMTPEEIKAILDKNAALKAEVDLVTSENREFKERQEQIEQAERGIKKSKLSQYVDGLIADGKVVPAQKDRLIAFMSHLDESVVIEFGEGESAGKAGALKILQDYLEAQPKIVDYSERSRPEDDDPLDKADAVALAKAAEAYKVEQAKQGLTISYAEAMSHVTSDKG